MNHRPVSLACLLGLSPLCGLINMTILFGQDSAPSSHMVFDDRFPGDIIINQVRVPKEGKARFTYYEALGWRGKAAGYAGIQDHPRGPNFIFSIWDHPDHKAPIRAVYHGAGTKTEGFGGEGTGLKSWNFELGWSTETWYTLVSRCWPVGEHTFFGFWVHSEETQRWTHLVTFDVAVPNARFEGGTDAFIEDWLSTGQSPRITQLRGGWKRRLDATWFPFQSARYSVNSWDLEKGKRSFNYRTNWDGGISDSEEPFYFMVSGGKSTKPSVDNPSSHQLKREEKAPDFPTAEVESVNFVEMADGKWKVTWEMDPVKAPPFSFQVELYASEDDGAQPTQTLKLAEAHRREFVVESASRPSVVRLRCRDLFDRESPTFTHR